MNKYYLQIVGAILLFIGCAAGGFFLSDVINLDSTDGGSCEVVNPLPGGGGETTIGGDSNNGGGIVVDNPEVPESPKYPILNVSSNELVVSHEASVQTFTYDVENPMIGVSVAVSANTDWITTSVNEAIVTVNIAENVAAEEREGAITVAYEGAESKTVIVKQEAKPQETPVELKTTPEIKSVWFPKFEKWPKKDPAKIGYRVIVTASVGSGDKLKYEMKSDDGKWEYTSTTGAFQDVYPTEDGTYTLTVTNINTNESVDRVVKGLVKRKKYTAEDIERQFRHGTLDSHFYFYFAPDVQFKCSGMAIPAESTPQTLNALVSVAGSFDIDVKDDTLQYDEWNRITSFEIELN